MVKDLHGDLENRANALYERKVAAGQDSHSSIHNPANQMTV